MAPERASNARERASNAPELERECARALKNDPLRCLGRRYDATVDAGVLGWLLGKHDDCQFVAFQTRMVLQSNATYAAALASLTQYKPLGPAYIILGGVDGGSDEGAVISKTFNVSAERHGVPWDPNFDIWPLREAVQAGSFFVLQTNYDRTAPPPSFDDRRYPAVDCLTKLGSDKLNAESLWRVMTSNPTRNGLTTLTMIMNAKRGHFEAYKTDCIPGPHCAPF